MDKTRLITTSPVVAATPPTRPAPVDMKAVRREIRAIRRGIGGSLDVLLQQVRTCLAADDPVTALNLLEVLADENVAELSFAGWHEPEIWEEGEGWEEREDRDDEPTGYFDELGPLWAKALLTRELPKAERPGSQFATELLPAHSHVVMALPSLPAKRTYGPVQVPAGSYFMMGDNRDNSFDSRYFGVVDRKQILGRATTVVLSLNRDNYWLPRLQRFFGSLDPTEAN